MKEEVGMKRRGPTWALVMLVAAGVVALTGSTALAQENIYENYSGLTGGTGVVVGGTGEITDSVDAGTALNPNGIGHYLVGTYYDVRQREAGGALYDQHNNIQIINNNTNNIELPICDGDNTIDGTDGAGCYEPLGGIYAKVRFRESKGSTEAFDFVIALSCGEVWAARLQLSEGGMPQIRSQFPVAGNPRGDGTIETKPYFNPDSPDFNFGFGGDSNTTFFGGGANKPAGISDDDVQRGYFEVMALEALQCEPDSGKLSLEGNTWTRVEDQQGAHFAPTHALGAEVFLVRPVQGISHNYNATAITRVAQPLTAPSVVDIMLTPPTFSEFPTWETCTTKGDSDDCLSQANLILSKSRVMAQYDSETATGGSTNLVVTMPTKYANCGFNTTTGQWDNSPSGPFECAPAGEETVCTIYDRLENLVEESEVPISPAPPGAEPCRLPREVTVIGLSYQGGENAGADFTINTSAIGPTAETGWFDLDLARNVSGAVIHSENIQQGADPGVADILGIGVTGYHGLPVVGLVMQEFVNDNVGGVYGNTVAPLYEQVILKEGQS